MSGFKGFTPKQERVLAMPQAQIEIHHGPVRTGKTIVAGARMYQSMLNAAKHEKVLNISAAAKNIPNCHRNIADSMRTVFSEKLVPARSEGSNNFYFKVHNGKTLLNVNARCLGWSTAHAENGILGWNIDGSMIDEVVMAPESLFQTNITRLDRPWARLICTTNPKTPRHWLKKNFIDKADGVKIIEVPWKHEDNPHLSRDYLDMLERTLHGVYYRRLVLGEWCSADGMIYPFINDSFLVNSFSRNPTGYFVGLDYGMRANMAAVMIAYNPALSPPAWVCDEWICDIPDYTILEAVNDFWAWVGARDLDAVYVDPSAKVLKNEMYRGNNRAPIMDADNDVTNGIHCTMSMITSREVLIGAHCDRLLDEMYNYCWDADRSDRLGEDVPKKHNDHLCDALRYALYTKWGDTCVVTRHKPVVGNTRVMHHDLTPNW